MCIRDRTWRLRISYTDKNDLSAPVCTCGGALTVKHVTEVCSALAELEQRHRVKVNWMKTTRKRTVSGRPVSYTHLDVYKRQALIQTRYAGLVKKRVERHSYNKNKVQAYRQTLRCVRGYIINVLLTPSRNVNYFKSIVIFRTHSYNKHKVQAYRQTPRCVRGRVGPSAVSYTHLDVYKRQSIAGRYKY